MGGDVLVPFVPNGNLEYKMRTPAVYSQPLTISVCSRPPPSRAGPLCSVISTSCIVSILAAVTLGDVERGHLVSEITDEEAQIEAVPVAGNAAARFVAYNSRFLVLPWVEVPHLAPHL